MGVRIDELENSIGELMAQVCTPTMWSPLVLPFFSSRLSLSLACILPCVLPLSQAGIDEEPLAEGTAPSQPVPAAPQH